MANFHDFRSIYIILSNFWQISTTFNIFSQFLANFLEFKRFFMICCVFFYNFLYFLQFSEISHDFRQFLTISAQFLTFSGNSSCFFSLYAWHLLRSPAKNRYHRLLVRASAICNNHPSTFPPQIQIERSESIHNGWYANSLLHTLHRVDIEHASITGWVLYASSKKSQTNDEIGSMEMKLLFRWSATSANLFKKNRMLKHTTF